MEMTLEIDPKDTAVQKSFFDEEEKKNVQDQSDMDAMIKAIEERQADLREERSEEVEKREDQLYGRD